jgi:tripeptide aminopeptidase
MVNKKRLIDSFMRMVETDSVSGQESRMRDLLKEEFSKRGLEMEEDNAGEVLGGDSGNLLLRIPGTVEGPTLLFAAHMDTVEPGRGIRAVLGDDDIIRSEGNTILGSDDKAAIASMLEAYDMLKENSEQHPPLEFLFSVGEEQGLQGIKLFDFGKLKAEYAYVMDAGGAPGTIVVQSPCQNEIEYTVYGRAAHSGINPEEGLNAIQIAARALAAMPCGRIDAETTCNFGIIEGGIARNIVADYCRIKGESRSLSRTRLEDISNQLESLFRNEVKKEGGRAEVEINFLYPEVSLNSEEKVVRLAVKAAEKIGLRSELIRTGGGSDASIINAHGLPCANMGVGMQAVHTSAEHISVQDLVNNARLILQIIREASR